MRHAMLWLVVAACSKGSAPSANGVDAANALIPADLRAQLHFELRTIEVHGRHFTLPVPTGWREAGAGEIERSDEPKHSGPPAFAASMTVRGDARSCDWSGEPCNEAPAVEQVEHGLFSSFSGPVNKVLANEVRPTERTSEVEDQFATYAIRAWWDPGATRFTYCVATLTDPLRPAVKAFAAACRSVHEQR